MSEHKIYKEFLPLVNDKPFLELLQSYAELRINTLKVYLETEKEPTRIYDIQGAIAELKRFRTIRDEIREKSKNTVMRNG